jgi:hypothetical protein
MLTEVRATSRASVSDVVRVPRHGQYWRRRSFNREGAESDVKAVHISMGSRTNGEWREMMHKFILSAVAAMAIVWVTVQPAFALVNAIGYYNSNPWGTKADIVTGNPTIRDGNYSWMRATVQYYPGSGPNYYAEIGWMKYTIGNIFLEVVSNDPTHGYFGMSYGYYPTVGSTHNYKLLWNSSLSGYDLSYDGTVIVNRPASLTLTRVFSGGEASSGSNGMGSSNNNSNQYANCSGGCWTLFPSHLVQNDPGYSVSYINANSWNVSGNN